MLGGGVSWDGREVKQRRGDDYEKRHLKGEVALCAYSISFNSSNVGKFLKDCIKIQETKKKIVVLCSRPRQNVKLGTFTQKSCNDR